MVYSPQYTHVMGYLLHKASLCNKMETEISDVVKSGSFYSALFKEEKVTISGGDGRKIKFYQSQDKRGSTLVFYINQETFHFLKF